MSAMESQITRLTIVYSTVFSGADQRKHQSSASLAFVRGIHQWPVKSPHKGSVTRNMFLFDDAIMVYHMLVTNLCGEMDRNHKAAQNVCVVLPYTITGLILYLRQTNETRRYFVTTSPIGWPQTSEYEVGTNPLELGQEPSPVFCKVGWASREMEHNLRPTFVKNVRWNHGNWYRTPFTNKAEIMVWIKNYNCGILSVFSLFLSDK